MLHNFLPELSRIENSEFHMRLVGDVDTPINPLPREGIFAEGNMEICFATILLRPGKSQVTTVRDSPQ